MLMNLLNPIDLEQMGIAKRQTLRKWRVSGRGPRYVKVGHHVKYDWRDVEAWLESRKISSTSEAA